MVSDEMKAFNRMARETLKPVFNGDFDPVAFRAARAAPSLLEETSTFVPLAHGRLEYRPTAGRRRLVAYVAGGGFCFDSNDSHRQLIDEVAARLDADACLIRYRLAPEHPFPAAFEDVGEGLAHLLNDRPAKDVTVIGDSAGAALILAAVISRLSAGGAAPGRMVFLSALTDMAMTGRSHVFNADADPLFGPQAIIHKAFHYLQGANPTDPRASPLWSSPRGLSPCLFLVGSTEVMLDDSRRFVDLAMQNGVDARLSVYQDAPHTFPLMGDLPEAVAARGELIAFLRKGWTD